MSQYTEHYNLKKPAPSENYDIDVANINNTIIDITLYSKVDKKSGKDLSTNDFTDEYKKKIDSMQTLYRFKGTVDNINDLSLINNCNIGDVYRCKEDMCNYVWNKTGWINIGQDNDFTNILDKLEKLKTEFYKGTNIIAETIEGTGKIHKLFGKTEGIGITGTIEIISKKGNKTSSKMISISNPLMENEYIDFIKQKIIRSNGTEEDIDCTCGITQYEGETTIYNTEGAELEVELTNNKAISSTNENIANLQGNVNKKVNKTGDTMTGSLYFENKNEFRAITKTRTVNNVDYSALFGLGGDGSASIELQSNGRKLARMDIQPDGKIKNNVTGKYLIEENELYYKKGDTLTLNDDRAVFSGLITGGMMTFKFSIPVPKLLKNISTITINTLKLNVRTVNGKYLETDEIVIGGFDFLTGSTVDSAKMTDNLVGIYLSHISGAFKNAVNNTPVAVQVGKVVMTFN